MRRKLAAAMIAGFTVFTVLTGVWPCKFSYPRVKRMIVATVYAQETDGYGGILPDCDCHQGGPQYVGDAHTTCRENCDWDNTGSYLGCGIWWMMSCSGSEKKPTYPLMQGG